MALQPAWRSLRYPVGNSDEPAQPAPFYRFYLLQADDHIARRSDDYFADVWCGLRKVVTLSREQVARCQPRRTKAAGLIRRNKHLRQQAVMAERSVDTDLAAGRRYEKCTE